MAAPPRTRVLLMGHSFIKRLAVFAGRHRSLGLDLRPSQYEIYFHGISGLTLPGLLGELDMVLTLQPHIVVLEIGTNDLSVADPASLSVQVVNFAEMLLHRCGVGQVISQVIYRDTAKCRYRVPAHFNDRVSQYNQAVLQLTASKSKVHFWRHRGVWSAWQSLLCDGVHYNETGQRKYFNIIKGAIIAMFNKLHNQKYHSWLL